MNTTTNYAEFLIIEDFLKDNHVPIASLDKLPRTIEKGIVKLDEPVKIDPKAVGAIGAMFEDITLDISWKTEEVDSNRFTTLVLEYRYTHPGGGSNGKSVILYSKNGSNLGTWEEVIANR
jgi:hypothetical protein